jgi:AraC-like DNA-binding protein
MTVKEVSKPKTGSPPGFFSTRVSQARRFYLDLSPAKSEPLVVVSGGCEHCTADYAIHRTKFPFYTIEFVLRGRGVVKLCGREHSLQPGRVYSYGAQIPHHIVGDPKDPLVKYFLNFEGKRASGLLRECKLPPGAVAQVFPAHDIQAIFDEIIYAGQHASPHGGAICAKLLEVLILKIADSRAPSGGVETPSFATYQHCRQFIQEHFSRLKTIEQLAGECHIDPAYLCRLFQRYDHQSPYQFLMRLKMNLAAEWLQQPGALVKQVAERAGFSDQFHFSRAFKNVFGVAPETFRRLR